MYQTGGPNVKWGEPMSNGGAGHHWSPPWRRTCQNHRIADTFLTLLSRRRYFTCMLFDLRTKQLHLLFSWKSVRHLNLVKARPSHVERISLRLYSLLVDFASALLRSAQVAYEQHWQGCGAGGKISHSNSYLSKISNFRLSKISDSDSRKLRKPKHHLLTLYCVPPLWRQAFNRVNQMHVSSQEAPWKHSRPTYTYNCYLGPLWKHSTYTLKLLLGASLKVRIFTS